MLKAIFSGLAGAKYTIIAAVMLGLLAWAGVLTARLASAQGEIRILNAEKQALEREKGALGTVLTAQNAGIQALADKSKQLDAASQRATVAVNRLAAATEARVKAIESAPTPATCEDAMRFLVDDAAGGGQ